MKKILKKELLAYLGMSVNTAIVGLSFIFMKMALRYTDPVVMLAHRFSFAFLVLILMQLFGLVKFPSFSFSRIKPLLLLALFYPLMFFLLQTFGIQYSTASEAGIIFAVIPVLTTLVASVFLKEKTNLLQKTGILMSVAGVFYIIFKTGIHKNDTDPLGVVLLLLSVLSIIAYYTIGRKLGHTFSPVELTVLMSYLAFIIFNIWALSHHFLNGTPFKFIDPLTHSCFLIPILYLGVLSSLLTSFLSNYALTAISASKIAVFNNLSPVIAVFGGVVFLNEKLYGYHFIGGMLVLVGVVSTISVKSLNKPKSNI